MVFFGRTKSRQPSQPDLENLAGSASRTLFGRGKLGGGIKEYKSRAAYDGANTVLTLKSITDFLS